MSLPGSAKGADRNTSETQATYYDHPHHGRRHHHARDFNSDSDSTSDSDSDGDAGAKAGLARRRKSDSGSGSDSGSESGRAARRSHSGKRKHSQLLVGIMIAAALVLLAIVGYIVYHFASQASPSAADASSSAAAPSATKPGKLSSSGPPHPSSHAAPPSPSPPASAPSTSPPTPPGPGTACSPSDCATEKQQALDAHNSFRAIHHADPLTWSDVLAGTSLQWAMGCVFKHSGGKLLAGGYGENLDAFAPETKNMTNAVWAWNGEDQKYDFNNPGFGEETGHFTQVVWKGTTQVGCAMVSCPTGTIFGTPGQPGDPSAYTVCQYLPAGNMVGDNNSYFKANVLPP